MDALQIKYALVKRMHSNECIYNMNTGRIQQTSRIVSQLILGRMHNMRPTIDRRQGIADEIRRRFQGTTTQRGRPTDYLQIRITYLRDPYTTTNRTINHSMLSELGFGMVPTERTRSRKRTCAKISLNWDKHVRHSQL